MKILIDDTILTYANAAVFSGYTVAKRDEKISTIDLFDRFAPDVYIGDINKLSKSVIKILGERPDLRAVFLGTGQEKQSAELTQNFGNLYPIIKNEPKADLVHYNKPELVQEFKSDVVAIDTDVNQSIVLPEKYFFRIFSSSIVHHNNYCGFVNEHQKKNFFRSSLVSISQGDHYFNAAWCGCYPVEVISVEAILSALNTNNNSKIRALKDEVSESKNNFKALSEIFDILNLDKESKNVISRMKELL